MLVTGASGFVGSLLCAELVKRGHPIRAALRSPNTVAVAGCETVGISGIDSHTDWADAFVGITSVIHLAARVHVMRDDSSSPLEEFRRVNVAGTERLARAAVAGGVKRLVFVSSIKVNGEATDEEGRFTESDEASPQDPYAVSKHEAEQALHQLAREAHLEVVIVRPPLVFGPGVKGNFLQMLSALSKGIPLPLASVQNRRSLVYVGNLVDALIVCATHPDAAGQTYLLSDGEDVCTPDLLRRLGAAMGRPARLLPSPPVLLTLAANLIGKSAQVQRLLDSLRIDSRKIRNELNWTPPYTLHQGLQLTAEWYRDKRP
ncbi:MAG: N-acetyl-alpha-D-glucosaminyl-diphospho-ditrans,octacis-undecaprenol 4-epimerase [Nitrospira sp.]|nr:N-acetyl-alpha-D-glucosaminyl-diphospho-ditrans,octacis-undecaprenol 4-epimerase [Nitrospira sp.]